jgi:hypothetical protein
MSAYWALVASSVATGWWILGQSAAWMGHSDGLTGAPLLLGDVAAGRPCLLLGLSDLPLGVA